MRSPILKPVLLLTLLSLTGCSGMAGSFSGPTEQTAPGLISELPSASPDTDPQAEEQAEQQAQVVEPNLSPSKIASISDVQLPEADGVKPLGLQLGAFSSAEAATRHMQHIKRAYPLLFEGRTPIVRTKASGEHTLYRVVLGPFSTRDLAEEFCDQLKVRQEGCFVADYNRIEMSTTN